MSFPFWAAYGPLLGVSANHCLFLTPNMPSVLPILFILVVIAGLIFCSYLFVPKGPHQT